MKDKFSVTIFIGLGKNIQHPRLNTESLNNISDKICFLLHRISIGFVYDTMQSYLLYKKQGIEKVLESVNSNSKVEFYLNATKNWDEKWLRELDKEASLLPETPNSTMSKIYVEDSYYIFFCIAVLCCKYIAPEDTKYIMDRCYELVFGLLFKEISKSGIAGTNSVLPPDNFFTQYSQHNNPSRVFAFRISDLLKIDDIKFTYALAIPISTINKLVEATSEEIFKSNLKSK